MQGKEASVLARPCGACLAKRPQKRTIVCFGPKQTMVLPFSEKAHPKHGYALSRKLIF